MSRRAPFSLGLRALGQWANLLVSGVLMLAVWILLVWVGDRPALKRLYDFTPQQRSTIDPVSIDLLHELASQDVKVEFHTFFERGGQAPQDAFQFQRQRILDRLRELTNLLLRQYAFHGGEHVEVREHDQYGDIATTREATQKFGVTETDVIVVAVTQPGRPPRHRTLSLEGDLGVVELPELRQTSSGMPRPVMPVLKDYKGEEALSSSIKSLLIQGVPVAYFVNGNSLDLPPPNSATGGGYSQLYQMLRASGFEPRELDLNRTGVVPEDAAVVAMLEPRRECAESEVRAIHAYLQRGGRLFVNYSWAAQPDWNPTGGELGRLLGYQVGPQPVYHLIVDPNYGSRVRGLDGDPRVSKLNLLLNANHAITMRLSRSGQMLQMDQARPLVLVDEVPQGVRREPLVYTGPQGWLAVPDRDGYPDTHAPRVENALSTFTLGAVVDVEGVKGKDGTVRNGAAVVTSGLFCNNLGMAINNVLASNVFNWLADRRVLLDIRGSTYVARHLELLPQQFDRIWWFLVAVVPGAFLCLGMFVAWRRRDR